MGRAYLSVYLLKYIVSIQRSIKIACITISSNIVGLTLHTKNVAHFSMTLKLAEKYNPMMWNSCFVYTSGTSTGSRTNLENEE